MEKNQDYDKEMEFELHFITRMKEIIQGNDNQFGFELQLPVVQA